MQKIQVSLNAELGLRQLDINRFEELFQIQYLPHLEFSDWTVEQWIRRACKKAHKKGKIGNLAIWLGQLHAKELESGAINDVSIRWIHETIGYGVFANRAFKKWDYVGEYTGIVRPRRRLVPDVNDYCFMYPSEWLSWSAFTIDSQGHGNYTRFINHSDTPNCESVATYFGGTFHIIFRAIQDIEANQELTYDYGSIYWLRRKKQVF